MGFSQFADGFLMGFSLFVDGFLMGFLLFADGFLMGFSLFVDGFLMGFSLFADGFLMGFSPFAAGFFMGFSLFADGLLMCFSLCSQYSIAVLSRFYRCCIFCNIPCQIVVLLCVSMMAFDSLFKLVHGLIVFAFNSIKPQEVYTKLVALLKI